MPKKPGKKRNRADHSEPTPPPVITANDRVLRHCAVLNDSVGYNSGHGLMFVGEKEIERVPCLAICHDKNSAQFTLYYSSAISRSLWMLRRSESESGCRGAPLLTAR